MQWLLGLPILLYCFWLDVKHALMCVFIYLFACLYIGKKSKSIVVPRGISFYFAPNLNSALSLLYALALTGSFYTVRDELPILPRVSGLFHLSKSIIVLVLCGLIFVGAYFCLRIIIENLSRAASKGSTVERSASPAKLGIRRHLFLFCCAFIAITICSRSSPLYPLNDSLDANCFFTVGKSMLSGLVPYLDLLEQKGPILYMIHALAALGSYDSFLCMWLIEILCCYAFLVYSYKTLLLWDNSRFMILLMPVIVALVCADPSFGYGDNAEELCLPALAFALFVGFKFLTSKKLPSAREGFVIGLTSACVLWVKYTLLGFYIGWVIVPAIFAVRNRECRAFLRMIAAIAVGVIAVTVPVLLYFVRNNAVQDLWQVYFYNNIFHYSCMGEGNLVLGLVRNLLIGFAHLHVANIPTLFSIILSVIVFVQKREKGMAAFVAATSALLFLCMYGGGRVFTYYALIFSLYTPLGVLFAWKFIKRDVPHVTGFVKRRFRAAAAGSLCLCVLLSLASDNLSAMFVPKSQMPQYIFKEVIENSGVRNPTLLNGGFLDGGFYTAAGIVPNVKPFCALNNMREAIIDEQHKIVEEGIPDFLVVRNKTHVPYEFAGYTLVASVEHFFEHYFTYWLYERDSLISENSADVSEKNRG